MAVNLGLEKRIDEVFNDYTERFVGNSIVFEGYLLTDYERAIDARLIRFISGGRRYIGYDLERDGCYVKGKIRYCALRPSFTRKDWEKVRLLKSKGVKQVDIAQYFGISADVVSRIVNRKGGYAE